ncbi:MAG: hypothetical protein ACJ74W_12040 [Pyrinomonadaceae bacterium]
MINLAAIDGLLDKAFRLACFIQGDREAALRIVADALAKLEVAVAAQRKRLYYRPAGRGWLRRAASDRFRNNVSFNEPHLLQRLILIEAEPYERALEKQEHGAATAGEEDLVIHFIKHLVRTTIKRNSFYVTLGLGRLLYSYTTAETMDIYNAVIQDPERVKDDYYYRSRKGVLMQELKERFGDLLNICRGPRGEERFETDDDQARFVALVRECLSLFTPWHTPCLVPAGVDPLTDGIPSLAYHGHEAEDKIEVRRIHAVLHPDCFERLVSDLRFPAPDIRLGLPRFFYTNDMNDTGSRRNDRRRPAALDEAELTTIKGALDEGAARRKTAQPSLLRVVVDGIERARFDPHETRRTRFNLAEDAELIEVRAHDTAGAELLLAAHLVAHMGAGQGVQPADASITLEGGQKISLAVSPATHETGALVDVTYRETARLRAASLALRRLVQSTDGGSTQSIALGRKVLVPALAFVFIAVCVGVVIKFARPRDGGAAEQHQVVAGQPKEVNNRAPQSTATDNNTATASAPTTTTASNNAADQKPPDKRTNATTSPQVAGARQQRAPEDTARHPAPERTGLPAAPDTATEAETSTRGGAAALPVVPLSAVKKVYVETIGDEVLGQSVRQLLGERLRASGRITPAGSREEADALLKVSIMKSTAAASESPIVLVQLINARGAVIWPRTNLGGKYQGPAAVVSADIVKDLLAAVRQAEKQ